jgi:hypothetical protein
VNRIVVNKNWFTKFSGHFLKTKMGSQKMGSQICFFLFTKMNVGVVCYKIKGNYSGVCFQLKKYSQFCFRRGPFEASQERSGNFRQRLQYYQSQRFLAQLFRKLVLAKMPIVRRSVLLLKLPFKHCIF